MSATARPNCIGYCLGCIRGLFGAIGRYYPSKNGFVNFGRIIKTKYIIIQQWKRMTLMSIRFSVTSFKEECVCIM